MGNERGFTMIEVMIVLVILMVLGALAYPSYAGYLVKIRRIEAQEAMIEALQQEERHYAMHNSYIAFSADALPEAPRFKWWSGSAASASAYELDAQACPGRQLSECIEVRARPGTTRVDARFQDADCGTLTLNSANEYRASGSSSRCWP
jgi:type IV pilus assembly protein PilE